MDRFVKTAAYCLLFWFGAACTACARDCAPTVRDGWARLPPVGVSMKMKMPAGQMPAGKSMAMAADAMMAGFGRIQNDCPAPATIVSASSPAFASVELHETRIVDGISRMRAVPTLRLAPGDAAVLKPGGLHLMLMQPRAPLQPGSKIAIEFKLSDGRSLRGEFAVKKATDP